MRVIKIYKTFTYAETDTLWGKRYQISIGGRRLTLLNYRSMLKFIEVLIYNGISQSDTAVPLGKLRDWIREIHALMGLNMQQFLETMATNLFWSYPGEYEAVLEHGTGQYPSEEALQSKAQEMNQIIEGQRISDMQMTHAETKYVSLSCQNNYKWISIYYTYSIWIVSGLSCKGYVFSFRKMQRLLH